MGQSKGGGYIQKDTLTPEQKSFLDQILGSAGGNINQAAQGYAQFLPGGGGGKAITDQANKNFQQQTIPSILNAFGTGSKGSSSLNQALAAGASNLNTDLASQLAQMQLQASQGLGNLGLGQGGLGASTPQFAYLQKQSPFWQSALLASLNAGSQGIRGALGAAGAG
jgi:hypothetical protein